jgi:16S rRNA G966 N2-methylase RsmD
MEPLFEDPMEAAAATPVTAGGPEVRADGEHRRSDSLYGTHAYHTKVPPSAIVEHILQHTTPGELVLDPFCGSGMTGVAAAMTGRRAFLNDLSPAACHIAANYTRPCSPVAFQAAVERVLDDVGGVVAGMYWSAVDGKPASVEYLVWSDVRACPQCAHEIRLWDVREAGLRSIRCPRCATSARKAEFRVVGEVPVQANLSNGGKGRVERIPTPDDLGAAAVPRDLPWYPRHPFDRSRPMWRRGHEELGIKEVADFYSRRNLAALSLLWDAAAREPDARLRSALRFSLTAIANRASRRYQWNPKRPTNVLGSTLYISSLRYEWNVLSLWRRKVAAVRRLFETAQAWTVGVKVNQGSAMRLPLEDNTADYCFTDPPFGGHIIYSDSSLLWEAWLDELTDPTEEAVMTRAGAHPKSVDEYGDLLFGSFAEIRRILRRGATATVIFQATDPKVWSAIQEAAQAAGLALTDVTTLNKGQPSFKQIKGRSAGERVASTDVVLTFRKRAVRAVSSATPQMTGELRRAVRAAVRAGMAARTGDLYGIAVAARLKRGEPAPSYDEVVAALEAEFTRSGDVWMPRVA